MGALSHSNAIAYHPRIQRMPEAKLIPIILPLAAFVLGFMLAAIIG